MLQTNYNSLTPLGEKIFLDRYALKDGTRETLAIGDLVVVCVDQKTGQREIGTVEALLGSEVQVRLRDAVDEVRTLPREHVDKPIETRIEAAMDRMSRGAASVEPETSRTSWEHEFRWALDDFKFVPAGRIWAGLGTDQDLTFFNCYVLPCPHDSRSGIIQTLNRMSELHSRGGGVGINLSTLRPRHAYVRGVNGRSSGSVSWGSLYSFVTGLIEQGGSRRGALMLILNDWHPDLLEFIESKKTAGNIVNANISVGVSDAFMVAVRKDRDWTFAFPDTSDPAYNAEWDGDLGKWRDAGRPIVRYQTVKARDVWNRIVESAWASAEPGLWFRDRANDLSNSGFYPDGRLVCTNPCGEEPLPEWGVCNLGHLNLAKMLAWDGLAPRVDWDLLGRTVRAAVRFLDNVIDVTPYHFEETRDRQRTERRIGLGTMGLAELLILRGIRYGTKESLAEIDRIFQFIAVEAYRASAEIAAEKGAFPAYRNEMLDRPFLRRVLKAANGVGTPVLDLLQEHGLRNVTLLTQAPTGTVGTMMNTSTGIEPFYAWTWVRKGRLGSHEEKVRVLEEWETFHPGEDRPGFFVTSMELTPEEHVRVQAQIQRWTDASISKTVNCPQDWTPEQVGDLYRLMFDLGCKGGTIYRDKSRDEQVLNLKPETQSPEVQSVRPRPRKRVGVTVSVESPAGTVHVTMNHDEHGEPFEVFVEVGKSGSDLKAMSEALGRTISLILRFHSHLPPRDRIEKVVEQLSGIGGQRSVGFGPRKVLSLPDAVARALSEVFLDRGLPESNGKNHDLVRHPRGFADLCPGCGNATFLKTEGCQTCQTCGYSEC